MTKKRRKVVESPCGTGRVFRGDEQIALVTYALNVVQEYSITQTFAGKVEMQGFGDVTGHIEVLQGERDLITGGTLILELADGRKWDFFAKSGDPLSGRYSVVNSSGRWLLQPK